MTHDEFMDIISNDISRILNDNLENTLTSIVDDISPSEYLKKEHLQLCKNTVTVSVQLSTQIVFSYLDSLGILNFDSLLEHFEPPVLKVVTDTFPEDSE